MLVSSSTLYNRIHALTDKTIVDLAARVGFNTPKYFSRCFKKQFGVLPKEYQ